jgi:C-terminal processing protease CtpA/Prc
MNSSASEQGIKLGDQILEMNGKDFKNCNNDCWCDHIFGDDEVIENQTLSIIILRDNKELKFQLKFKKLL